MTFSYVILQVGKTSNDEDRLIKIAGGRTSFSRCADNLHGTGGRYGTAGNTESTLISILHMRAHSALRVIRVLSVSKPCSRVEAENVMVLMPVEKLLHIRCSAPRFER